MPHPYRLVIAEDQVVFRQLIGAIIENSDDLKLVGDAGDGLELLELLQTTPADMVIIDLAMPRLDGLKAIPQIKENHANLKVIVLTLYKSKECLVKAMAAGANGFLLKDHVIDEFLPAVAVVRGGGHFISKIISLNLSLAI